MVSAVQSRGGLVLYQMYDEATGKKAKTTRVGAAPGVLDKKSKVPPASGELPFIAFSGPSLEVVANISVSCSCMQQGFFGCQLCTRVHYLYSICLQIRWCNGCTCPGNVICMHVSATGSSQACLHCLGALCCHMSSCAVGDHLHTDTDQTYIFKVAVAVSACQVCVSSCSDKSACAAAVLRIALTSPLQRCFIYIIQPNKHVCTAVFTLVQGSDYGQPVCSTNATSICGRCTVARPATEEEAWRFQADRACSTHISSL